MSRGREKAAAKDFVASSPPPPGPASRSLDGSPRFGDPRRGRPRLALHLRCELFERLVDRAGRSPARTHPVPAGRGGHGVKTAELNAALFRDRSEFRGLERVRERGGHQLPSLLAVGQRARHGDRADHERQHDPCPLALLRLGAGHGLSHALDQ